MSAVPRRRRRAPDRSAPSRPVRRLRRLLRRRHGLAGPLFAGLVLAVLGLGLAGLLVLNTAAAQDAFQLHRLQEHDDALVQQEQQLRVALLEEQSPYRLSARAVQDGLRPVPEPRFMRVRP